VCFLDGLSGGDTISFLCPQVHEEDDWLMGKEASQQCIQMESGGVYRVVQIDQQYPDMEGTCGLHLFFRKDPSKSENEWEYIWHFADEQTLGGGRISTVDKFGCWGRDKLFVVTSSNDTGTGVSIWWEDWYLISPTDVTEVLRLDTSGYVYDWGMPFNREFDSEILKAEAQVDTRQFLLEIRYHVTYTNADTNRFPNLDELFSYDRVAAFVMDVSAPGFFIDQPRSEMTWRQVEGIFGESSEGFLRNNFADLVRIAESDDTVKRSWLSHFLKDCSHSSEKAELLEIMK